MSVSRSIVILPPAPQSNPQSAIIRPRDDEFGLQPNAGRRSQACTWTLQALYLVRALDWRRLDLLFSAAHMPISFIRHPGLSGPFGALMDEYARAAEDFCGVVESFDPARFLTEHPSNSPTTISPQAICAHVCGAAHRYAHYIRKARGLDFVERYELEPSRVGSPQDVRGLLAEAITFTEATVEPLLRATDEEIQRLSFTVRWGPRYDPEMILEHAVCHLLRHRRQLERW